MHPTVFALSHSESPAYIMAQSGEVVTYGQLEERSNAGAQLFRKLGLGVGDVVALLMDNDARFFEIVWAAQRSGLYFACISVKLKAEEIAYIVRDSGAKVLIASSSLGEALDGLPPLLENVVLFGAGGAPAPWRDFEAERARMPTTSVDEQTEGEDLLYSSGTTGRPKGIKNPLSGRPIVSPQPTTEMLKRGFQIPEKPIYLCPAPLYHAGPLKWCMSIHRMGGTVVIMERFDPEDALRFIETYRVNCGQFVPTHFVRMLKLPAETRGRYDLSSLQSVVHAAAPCPVPVKEQMLDWWGPVIYEYYSGTEAIGMTAISPQDWLTHRGSVGRSIKGEIRICDEAGEVVPPRTVGAVFFANGPGVTYHNAPEKVAEMTNKHGWVTFGDVGWQDEEGYLYLTDRQSFMIISGGVNIYPQEIENLLVTHPDVMDAAVVGAPDEEMGEKVVAVVQLTDPDKASPDMAAKLQSFCRAKLSHVKAPRLVEFTSELPRHPTGKLYKRLIRDRYWGKADTGIV